MVNRFIECLTTLAKNFVMKFLEILTMLMKLRVYQEKKNNLAICTLSIYDVKT